MKDTARVLIIAFLLAACTTLTPSIQPLSTQADYAPSPVSQSIPLPLNPTPAPFNTLTPDEIANLDLGSILVQPSDLPEGYTSGEVIDKIPDYIDLQGATCEYRIYQGFVQNNENAGGVTLVICTDETVGQAMASLRYDMWPLGYVGPLGDVGNEAQYIGENMGRNTLDKNPITGVEGKDILFNRCDAVVYIRMTGTIDWEPILSYAKKLDERLITLVCP